MVPKIELSFKGLFVQKNKQAFENTKKSNKFLLSYSMHELPTFLVAATWGNKFDHQKKEEKFDHLLGLFPPTGDPSLMV
jgi:hypothetical protein